MIVHPIPHGLFSQTFIFSPLTAHSGCVCAPRGVARRAASMASTLSDALLRSLGRSGTCRDLAREIVPPRIPSAKNAWTAGTDTWRDRSSLGAVARPVWVMMPFGSDLRMLQLHLATLADVTTGFLVTESTFTFTRHRSKPALATEALKNGTFPPEIAAKMEVRVGTHSHTDTHANTHTHTHKHTLLVISGDLGQPRVISGNLG